MADIEATVSPMREKRNNITDDEVRTVLADGAKKAKNIASAKMDDVRTKIGVKI